MYFLSDMRNIIWRNQILLNGMSALFINPYLNLRVLIERNKTYTEILINIIEMSYPDIINAFRKKQVQWHWSESIIFYNNTRYWSRFALLKEYKICNIPCSYNTYNNNGTLWFLKHCFILLWCDRFLIFRVL